MADTTLQLLNRVLRGLRKTELDSGTTSVDDDYHKLLLDWLNVAKEEVEEAWDWEELQVTATITQSAVSDVTMSLEASDGFSDTDITNKARMLYEQPLTHFALRSTKTAKPMIFDVTDSNEFRLKETSVAHIIRLRATDQDDTGDPCYFALRDNADGFKELLIWPTPNQVRTFQLTAIQPQAELPNATLDATQLSVPSRPVWTRALLYANQERGEELSRPGSTLDRQQETALANAINAQMTDEDRTAFVY